jgi:hypothetical protein
VRLSRSRVLLRAALLVVGSVFMLAKAWEAHGTAADAGAGAALLRRVALVEALVGVLALAAAAMALLALRPPRRAHSLRLRDLDPAPREGSAPARDAPAPGATRAPSGGAPTHADAPPRDQ